MPYYRILQLPTSQLHFILYPVKHNLKGEQKLLN